MIDDLKKAADEWFGDNGDEYKEIAFVLGYLGQDYTGPFKKDFKAGYEAGMKGFCEYAMELIKSGGI